MKTMTKNFTYSFTTSKTPEEVYELLLHIEQWWSGLYDETIKGKSQRINDEFSFKAGGGAHYTKQKLIDLIPNKKIVWLVTEANLAFVKETSEWEGTKIAFDISVEGNKTKVMFTHEGLVPEFECYADCSMGWTGYLDKLKKKLN
ncbi:MAG TPA: SRPBCC domain-containing protein [Puia sp.]|nr:SRPBCC domain-containing protein [Puia sp.]